VHRYVLGFDHIYIYIDRIHTYTIYTYRWHTYRRYCIYFSILSPNKSIEGHNFSVINSFEKRLDVNVQSSKGHTTLMSTYLYVHINSFFIFNSDRINGWALRDI
jgi:hypothetical protein